DGSLGQARPARLRERAATPAPALRVAGRLPEGSQRSLRGRPHPVVRAPEGLGQRGDRLHLREHSERPRRTLAKGAITRTEQLDEPLDGEVHEVDSVPARCPAGRGVTAPARKARTWLHTVTLEARRGMNP